MQFFAKAGKGGLFGGAGTILNGLRRLRVAAPSIRFVPWAALASCWPLPQQLLPVSATGGGRRRCWAYSAEELFKIRNSGKSAELVGAKPLHLLTQTALPLKSPTGAFIAALRFANAVQPQTLLMVRT